MNDEVWKPWPEVPFIEGSSWGRVRTLDKVVLDKRGGKRLVKGRVLKQGRSNSGYLYVHLSVNGKQGGRFVHRIIAACFLPNPDNLPQVNHKDCDPTNNNVDNLEWCDASYNCRYREKYGKTSRRPMFAINLKTSKVLRFESQHEASQILGISDSNINRVLKGHYKQAGGYWFTEDGDRAAKITKGELHEITARKPLYHPVFAINLATLEVSWVQSQSEAGRVLGVQLQSINNVIKGRYKTAKGYWFTNADSNAVEATRDKLGDSVADKVEDLMTDKELQLA